MTEATTRFRDFEQGRWEDPGVCATYADRLGPVVDQAVRPLLDDAGARPGTAVLDIATGNGLVAAAAARRGATAVGVDFSAEQLRRARGAHPGVRFEQGDAEALPFGDASFDAVVCNFGVPHFADPDAFLRESLRVLRPGGRLAYTAWATPEHARAFGAVFAAVTAHGTLDVGLPPGPDFFLHADGAAARAAMTRAGFAGVACTVVGMTWRLRDPSEVMAAMEDGTARTAALLRLQKPAAIAAIRRSVAQAMAAYGDPAGGYAVPMPAVLTSGARPGAS